mmetsp:Transcript_623/g.617  ORF Transcript_623/g.617 Transcript_623/m.617 type:complete len:128 (+) Transcript_623:1-384(+)
MGKKKTEVEAPKAEEPKKDDNHKEEEEDGPLIKELKELDDKYLAIEKEYEKAVQELQKQYTAKQQPFLSARTEVLSRLAEAPEEAKDKGTPSPCPFALPSWHRRPSPSWPPSQQSHPSRVSNRWWRT